MEDDSLLVRQFKNKDMKAFDQIFSKYHKSIYYYIYKMAFNAEVAEDITQDTFVKVYKHLNKVDDHVKLSTWIYKIAYNTFIDFTRKNKVTFELIDNVEYDNKAFESNQDNPEESYMNKELKNKINRTMQKLNNRYKSVLILREYNNLSYKEVASILELSETAVKSLIHRARLEFQKIFKEL